MTNALFIVTEEGYWGEECIEPLTTLDDAGVAVTVATPTGKKPVIDDRSIDPDEVGSEYADHLCEIHENDPRLNSPEALGSVDASDYDAIVFPGGHGTEFDITHDRHAREALRTAVEGDHGVALVVCHAVGILAFTRGSDGSMLVADRDVTGFPNEWEEGIVDEDDRMPDGRKLPYWVEDEVRAAGAEWDAELDSETSVAIDGDLITGRGPGSSSEAAKTLLDNLSIESAEAGAQADD
jgi:putative intracellular protease/amidase